MFLYFPSGYERQLSPSSEDTEISTIPASIAANADFPELDNSSKNTDTNAGMGLL